MEVSEDNEKEVAILFISVLRAAAKNFDNTRGYKIDWDWVSSSSQCVARFENTVLV